MKKCSAVLATVSAGALLALLPSAAHAITYNFLTDIAVPPDLAVNPSGDLSAFDISYFDPVTNLYVLGDRSNAGIDIISGASLTFLGRAGGFAGATGNNATSGPDGVVIAHTPTGTTLFGGDGPSLLRAFSIANPASPVQLGYSPVSSGGMFRVDEMAYSPSTNLLLAANNADQPAFGTLFNASTGAIVHGHISIPGAGPTDGLEQPVWDPKTNSFYISVPSFNGDPGGVAQINPDGTVGTLYKFAALSGGAITACSPTGLALGASGNLLVGCGTAKTQTVLLNPTANGGAGAIVATNTSFSGSDEVYFNPALDAFYVTGTNAAGQRIFAVLADDASLSTITSVDVPNVNAHSIAVNPLNGDVFLPLEASASNDICTAGCVAVYATSSVPEPGTVSILAGAMTVLGWLGWRRRKSG